MGQQSFSPLKPPKKSKQNINHTKQIQDIYSMFEQSNRVLVNSVKHTLPQLQKLKITHIQDIIFQLVQPFQRNCRYDWGKQISIKFLSHFKKDFQIIWFLNRQQFYQLLLYNCKAKIQNESNIKLNHTSIQDYFYTKALQKISNKICDNLVNNLRDQHNIDFVNESIIDIEQIVQQKEAISIELPLFLPHNNNDNKKIIRTSQVKSQVHVEITELQTQDIKLQEEQDKKVDESQTQYYNKIKLNKCSLLISQNLFTERQSSQFSKDQVRHMLRYYHQFTLTMQQIFCSNNLLSCPLKDFVFSIQSKIKRKKIKNSAISSQEISSHGIQSRKLRKTREYNNNLLLYQIKEFLLAYTQFVWMYLQLNLMAQSRLSKIINPQILYGIIFKSVWGFVDWIAERGFQFQQKNCQIYYNQENIQLQTKLKAEQSQKLMMVLQALRNQKHPQQYLKKVVVFYRQVSKKCQNADELLSIYEQIIGKTIKRHGCKGLNLFRMRNIIQKLLNIDEYSMGGGQISYSWTTWCIVIQLLRQKINFKYGQVVIIQKQTISNINMSIKPKIH